MRSDLTRWFAVALVVAGTNVRAAAQQPAADTTWTLEHAITGRALPCTNGHIKTMTCDHVELLSYLPASALGGRGSFDLWGWTDSTTGREFILLTDRSGTAFVEVTDPVNPRYLGRLPLHDSATQGLPGVKVYKNHAFIISEILPTQGMQIFDLTQLRDVKSPPVTFQETAHYDKFGSAHTIALNEATGFAYVNGSLMGEEICGAGLHMIDVRTPTSPVFAGCYIDGSMGAPLPGYVHDVTCVLYRGPDQQYRAREICVYASGTAVGIADVTDKTKPKKISTATYPNTGYTHQGWFTKDQRYFFLDDEGKNERRGVDEYPTVVFDLNDLDDPVLATTFPGGTSSTDHNLYIQGDLLYQASYGAGLRIQNVSDPTHPKEVGYLDTSPTNDFNGLENLGAWGTYPFLKNGVVAVASAGLFLARWR